VAVIGSSKPRQVRELERFLGAWDARLRLLHSLIWFPRGLAAGLLIGLIIAIIARARPLIPSLLLGPVAVIFALVGVIATLVAVWLWRRSPLQLARRFDLVFGLKERTSTAIELSQGKLPIESEFLASRQLEQTLRVAQHVRASQGLPVRVNWREWLIPIAVIALLVVAILLPNPQDRVIAQAAAVNQAIDRQAEELRDLKEEVLKSETLSPEDKLAVVQALDEAIQTLDQNGVTQQEAVAAMQAAEQELRDISQQDAARAQAAMEAASGKFDGTAAQSAGEALQQGDAAAAADALQNINPSNLSPAEQQALADALEQAAQDLQDTNPEAAQAMQDAADALRQGDAAQAQQSLEQAGQALEQGNASGQQVQGYADKVQKGQQGVAQAGRPGQQGNQQGQDGQGQDGQQGDQQGQDGQGQNGQEGNQPGNGQGGNQPGENGMGQAQPIQPGAGSQNGQGQGQGSHGAGRGEGNGETAPGQGGPMDTDNGPGDGGETSFPDIFDPQRIGGEGGPNVDVPGNPEAGAPTGAEGNFAPNPNGESTVPYNQVFGDYAGAVNQALDSGYVPLGLRGVIQQYFGNLDPTSSGK